jgi:hypothetical protein
MLPPDDRSTCWRLPEIPSGGPEAARDVAATCDGLAALLRSTAATLTGVRQLCATNTGRAADAIDQALHAMQREHEIAAGDFERSAQAMRRFADDLAAAQRRHHFSLSGMLKAGAILVGGAAAVWVTLGAAGPAVVAAVGAEVAVAESAAAAATAACESAAAEFSLLARAFAALRGVTSISRMQLVYGEIWMTAQSVRSEVMDGRILPSTSPRAIALDLAGMAAGAGAGKIATFALAGRAGAVGTTVAATAASALGGAAPQTVDEWERTGSFPASSFAWDAAKGATSSVISGSGKKALDKVDKWKAHHHPRPQPGKHRRARSG